MLVYRNAIMSAMDTDSATEYVWRVRDPRVYDELQKPVAFIVHGLGQTAHRSAAADAVNVRALGSSTQFYSTCAELGLANCAALRACKPSALLYTTTVPANKSLGGQGQKLSVLQ